MSSIAKELGTYVCGICSVPVAFQPNSYTYLPRMLAPPIHRSCFPDVQCALLAYVGPHITPGEISPTCASLSLCPSSIRVSITEKHPKNLGPSLTVLMPIPPSNGPSTSPCSLVSLWSLLQVLFCLGHPQGTLAPTCHVTVGC